MDENRNFSDVQVVWEPKEDSGLLTKKFMKKVEGKYGIKMSDYWDLHRWSIEHIEDFYNELWQLSGIIYSTPYHQVIDLSVPMGDFHEWFAGAKMNYAENLLKYRDNHVALIAAGEDKPTRNITYAEVYEETKIYAAALRKSGIKKDDIVACYMSNREEAVFAMIAATSLGAIWVGVLPLMGPQAVLNRLSQVQPKILFTVDRFPHNKEELDMLPKLKEVAEGLQSLQKVIIVASKPESGLKDISGIRNSYFLHDFLETAKETDGSVPEMTFEQVPFTHPVFISYTSGTTGLPKVLHHSSGILLGIFRDFCLQNNNDDRNSCWLSMSPVGWATWNVFASMLFLGIRVFLFEGVPYFLSPTFFWDLVDEYELSHLLLVTNILDDMEKKGYAPTKKHHLRSLKFIGSAGSVVKERNYDFVYSKVKQDVIFTSVYGSTECAVISLYHDETLKLHKCEIPSPSLGINCQSVDDSGKPLIGEIGEMVFATPFPTLPLGLWGDRDRSLFKKSYCQKYPGKFAVGDLMIINPVTKGIIICGRSDETLKPGGCRFGSSEIYCIDPRFFRHAGNDQGLIFKNLVSLEFSGMPHNAGEYGIIGALLGEVVSDMAWMIMDSFPEIEDSICVSQFSKDGVERAVLFLQMKGGYTFNQELVERLRAAIARTLSVRHVPEVILETGGIPRNINGKKLESIVKKIINNMSYNAETVINPECLIHFTNLPKLSGF